MSDLTKGANAPLTAGSVEVVVSGARPGGVDVLAFQVGAGGTVRSDADLVFFNQPASPEGAVRLLSPERLSIDLTRVPTVVETIAVCVAVDDDVPGPLAGQGALVVRVEQPGAAPVTAPAVGLTSERAAVLVEIYRRAGGWKVRCVSAGWTQGTAALAREYGVAVDEPAPPAPVAPPRPTAPAPPARPEPPAAARPASPSRPVAAPAPAGYVAPAASASAPPPGYPPPGGFPPPGGSLPPPHPTGTLPRSIGGFPPPGGDPPPAPRDRVPELVGGFPPPGNRA